MANLLLEHRLRVRDAGDTTDVLTVTSVRGGTYPYLPAPPVGDGSSIDPLSGRVIAGTFTGQVTDPIITGSSRLFTSILEDAGGRQQIGDRKAYWEFRTNGGAWTTLICGLLTHYKLRDDVTWDVTVSDPMLVEHAKKAFSPRIIDDAGTKRVETIAEFLARWPSRGCLFGGPVIGGFLGQADRKGWEMKAAEHIGGGTRLQYVGGYGPPEFKRTTRAKDHADVLNDKVSSLYRENGTASSAITTFEQANAGWWPGVLVEVIGVGYFQPTPVLRLVGSIAQIYFPRRFMVVDAVREGIFLSGTTLSTGSTIRRVRAFTAEVSELSPIYFTGHPTELLTKLWDEAWLPYDSAAVAAVAAKIGLDRRLSIRITEPQDLGQFLEDVIYGPFGIGVRSNATGQLAPFATRVFTNTPPAVTLTDSDVIQQETRGFDLDTSSSVRRFFFEHQELLPTKAGLGDSNTDGFVVESRRIERTNGDPGAIGNGEVTYSVPGMVHTRDSYTPDAHEFTKPIAKEVFDRYGRGLIKGATTGIRGGVGDGITLGQEILVALAQLPNKNKRRIDDVTVPARWMQVVHLTPTPRGYEMELADSGPNANAIATLPTHTIAASSDQPRRVAELTITNAATLNAASLGVRIQMAVTTGATPSTDDYVDVISYDPGAVPTGAIRLPAVISGRKVYARARSEKLDSRPSNFQTAVSVTLNGITAPSSLSVTPDGTDGSKALVTWTNGGTVYETDVYLRASGAPSGDAIRQIALPPESDRFTLEGLTPGNAYTVGVQHRDAATGDLSSMVESAFTASATTVTLAAPLVPTAFAGSVDPETGVPQRDGVYGIAVMATELPSYVEVDEAVETSVGSGTYGAFSTMGRVSSVAGAWSRWFSTAPNDGKRRQLRARHVRDGATSSSYAATVTVLPWTPLALPMQPSDICVAQVNAADGDEVDIVVTSTAGGKVRLVSYNNAAPTAGAAVGTLVASGSIWTFPRNAFQVGQGSATFEAVTPGFMSDPDTIVIPEQGRDTVSLRCSCAYLVPPDAQHVDVRVTALDSLAVATGIAVSVESNVGVSAPSVIAGSSPVNHGGFVDYRITRPAAGSPPGRVKFKVSVAGRVDDFDDVDVPAQEPLVPSLDVVPTISTTNVSFAFTSNGTVEYKIDAGGWSSASSPVVVARNASGGAAKQVQLRATKDGQTILWGPYNVPAQDAAPPGRSFTGIGIGTVNYTADTIEVDWFITGFVSGDYFRLMRSRNGAAYAQIATGITATFYVDNTVALTDDIEPAGSPGPNVTFDYRVEWYDSGNVLRVTSSVASTTEDTA